MIPTEMITFGATFAMRAMQQHFANSQEMKANEQKALLKLGDADEKARKSRMDKFSNEAFGYATALLALIAFLSIIVWPKVLPFLDASIPINMAYVEDGQGWFLRTFDKMKFQKLEGLVITDMDRHLVFAIAGLFFGGIKRRLK